MPSELSFEQPAPNPTSDEARITFNLPTDAQVKCTLHNTFGREVMTITDGQYTAGRHNLTVILKNIPSGVYHCRLCRLHVGAQMLTKQLTIIR